ncbi:hypothetical protein XAB3213_10003 [Xanthomonas citri pv. bilvae]|nr:hypothetical protein XAB3213_10003 [Xanthomonas citri pv. bilvae]
MNHVLTLARVKLGRRPSPENFGTRRVPVPPLMPVSSEHTKPEWQGAGARLVDQTDAQPR